MSLERTALRLAAVMALSNGFTAPYPTMAGNRVFDSRQDPIAGLEPDQLVPLLTLYTDDDQGEGLSTNNGGPPFERRVQLVIELSLGMLGESATAEGVAGIVLPETEPELDAMLDLFERQVEAVFLDGFSTWARELSKVTRRIEKWSSMRFIEREGNVRLAARQLQITVALPLAKYHDPLLDPSTSTPTPTASIPAPLGPLLAAVAASASPYAGTAAALQTMMTASPGMTPIVLPALERIRFFEASHLETNGAGTPRGPRQAGVAQATLPTS
mgnify:CR=1 FL=1